MTMPKHYDFVVRKPYKAAARIEELEARIENLFAEYSEKAQLASKLEAQLYDAYGLGIADGLAMERYPLGFGEKTKEEALAALEAQK